MRSLRFAELGSFIDAPLRTYSSGMAARLGFAVATAWQPDILLVDEVLAVGDEAFQRKCHVRMQGFRDAGATVLMVAHDMNTIMELCGRAAWLEHGKHPLSGASRARWFAIIGPDRPKTGPANAIRTARDPRSCPYHVRQSSPMSEASSLRPTTGSNSGQPALPGEFVQDNHSGSMKGALRGLHYQIRQPQGKLVRVIAGEVFDVAVDLRRSSPSFGRWVGAGLSAERRDQLWIPPGFAHGFYVLSEWAEVLYKATDYYAPQWERCLLWNDPQVGVEWPISAEVPPILSEKDSRGAPLSQAEVYD